MKLVQTIFFNIDVTKTFLIFEILFYSFTTTSPTFRLAFNEALSITVNKAFKMKRWF